MTVDDEWNEFLTATESYVNNSCTSKPPMLCCRHSANASTADNDSRTHPIDSINADANQSNDIVCRTNTATPQLLHTHVPMPSPVHISTKSKIAYLNCPIDLAIFWDIPIASYSYPFFNPNEMHVIKKQIKITCESQAEYEHMQHQINQEPRHCEQIVIKSTRRIKFQEVQKISIGISSKDINVKQDAKQKHAFFNCFVLILRVIVNGGINNMCKEYHAKVFNTGKIEIPGVPNDDIFDQVLNTTVALIQKHTSQKIEVLPKIDTILINSNFNCNFYINREALCNVLKKKYRLDAVYDPCCSYPGIQCKFCYEQLSNSELHAIHGGCKLATSCLEADSKITFMIFRTGNVLIGGRFDETVLKYGYDVITSILQAEYTSIYQCGDEKTEHVKKRRVRRLKIYVCG